MFDFHFVDSENETYVTWQSQFTKETMNDTGFKEAILKSKRDDDIFKLNFISFFVNMFAESHSYGTCNIDPVRRVVGVEDISCIDWCAYLNCCLKNTRFLWHQDKKKCYYNGPILLLMVCFLFSYFNYFLFMNI